MLKRTNCRMLLSLIIIASTTGPLHAGLITTLFARNNGGSDGGAVYFDIDVLNPAGISVEKLFTNTADSFVNGNMNVYTRPGTAFGFETSLSGWTLVSSGTGSSAGPDNPSEFDITDFFLGQGVTGIAIESQAGVWGHDYTNGTASNNFYSNSDLTLSLGSASNSPFSSSPFNPRIWNGTIEYSAGAATAVPEPSSLAILGIGACVAGFSATRRRRTQQPESAA